MSSVDPTRTGSSKGTKRSGTPIVGKGKGKKGKSKEELQSVADDLSTQHGALSRRLFACAQQGSVQALAMFRRSRLEAKHRQPLDRPLAKVMGPGDTPGEGGGDPPR